VSTDLTELTLQLGTRPLSFEDFTGLAASCSLNELEGDVPTCSRIYGQDNQRHATATDLTENLVRAQAMEDGVHGLVT
jgi:hypothetical protein